MNIPFAKLITICVLVCSLYQPVLADTRFGQNIIYKEKVIEIFGAGPNIQAVINSIVDASESNPYLIKLGPGTFGFTETLITSAAITMKPYVSIQGSGPGVTILKGAFGLSSQNPSADSAIVQGADFATISDLSIVNTGDESYSIGIYNNADLTIRNVIISASGATSNIGIYNIGTSDTKIIDVTSTAEGTSSNNYGIYNTTSSPVMKRVVATAKNGTSLNYAIENHNTSSPKMHDVTAEGSNTSGYGMVNCSTCNPVIFASDFYGSLIGVDFGSSTNIRIIASFIDGGIATDSNDSGSTNCGSTFTRAFVSIAC